MKRSLTFLLIGAALGATAEWKDPLPCGDGPLLAGDVRVDVLADNLFRVRVSNGGAWMESGLNRYGILRKSWPETACERSPSSVKTKSAQVTVNDGATLTMKSFVSAAALSVRMDKVGKGFRLAFPLAEGERVYGLGDVSRANIQRRPGKYEIWVKNVNSYIPMPMALTSRGWGLLVNTTWRNFFDVGETDRDKLVCSAPEGCIDYYVFVGRDYRALLDVYTRLTGRPQMLPAFGYGFTYVANENADMFRLMDEAMQFRDRDMPCDVIGLEPGWMETFYDRTTRKEWNKARFVFPYWAPKGGHTFIGALNRMGFKLSLWLCCGYDLFRYEEQCAAGEARKFGLKPDIPDNVTETWQDDRITGENKDPRLKSSTGGMLKKLNAQEGLYEEGKQPWFEHLKKFVDQGVQCFKLDGAYQVIEGNGEKNRQWANARSDEENHNLYPVVYDKQMARGYEEYTRRRSMVYSAGGYAGVQQFVATWAGDTGGGEKPCASLLNLGMSGHANQSCDMNIMDVKSLHFGMLQTWSQQNNWAYWFQPWYQRKEAVDGFRNYLKLRYRLFPYIYTAAAEAHATGWPVMRSLPFEYPDVPAYDACKTTYLLGPNLLVSAFTDTAEIPAGKWYEWRTDRLLTGPTRDGVAVTPAWGGGLYVKAGAAIPTWPETCCIDRGWNRELVYEVYGGADGDSSLYEDDGVTLKYREGGSSVATIPLSVRDAAETLTFSIGRRKGGSFTSVRSVTVRFHGLSALPKATTFDGKPLSGVWDDAAGTYAVGPVEVGDAGGRFVLIR